ncbi:MAG: hypothetical protein ACR2MB_16870 [Acidimicrobiales bacterium]
MGIVVVFLAFGAVGLIAVAALVFGVVKRSIVGVVVALLAGATVWSFGNLVYLLLFADPGPDGPDVSTGDFVMPGVLLLATIVVLWVWAFSKNPKLTSEITMGAVVAVDAAAVADTVAKRRRVKYAKAVADEIENRTSE